MKIIPRIIFHAIVNVVAFYALAYFMTTFEISNDFIQVLTAALFLTAVNIFIRPILKFFLSPFIIITFGLFVVVINTFLLYGVDNYSDGINIVGFQSLVLSAVIISIFNLLVGSSAKSIYRKSI